MGMNPAKRKLKKLRNMCRDIRNRLDDKIDALKETEGCYTEKRIFVGHEPFVQGDDGIFKGGEPMYRPLDDEGVAFLYEEVMKSLSDISKETNTAYEVISNER